MKSLLLQIALILTVTLILMVEGRKGCLSGCCRCLRCWEKQMKCKGYGGNCRCVDDDIIIGISGPRNVIDKKYHAVANELGVEKSPPKKKASQTVETTADDNAESRRGHFKENGYRVADDILEEKTGPSTVFDKMNNLVTNLWTGTTELPRVFIQKKSGVDIYSNEVEEGDATVFDLKNADVSDGIVQDKSEPPYMLKRKDKNANERKFATRFGEREVDTKADISKHESNDVKEFNNDKHRTSENNDVDKDKRVIAMLAQILRRLKSVQKKREGGQVNAASKGIEDEVLDQGKVHAHFKFSGSATNVNNRKEFTRGGLEEKGLYEDKRHTHLNMAKLSGATKANTLHAST